jgi:hypothetical protein
MTQHKSPLLLVPQPYEQSLKCVNKYVALKSMLKVTSEVEIKVLQWVNKYAVCYQLSLELEKNN